MKNHVLTIVHLYPKDMNLYGDTGNRLVLERRLAWRGLEYRVVEVSVGDKLPHNADIIIGGGGQDASQGEIEQDFLKRTDELRRLTEDGAVMLMICGMYQLLGRKFVTHEGVEIHGAGILPVDTYAKKKRLIGNISVEIDGVGVVVGYENHSGQTFLDSGVRPLGKVLRGVGNNEDTGTEGCRYRNIFATYMHGPVLAKNPELADLLIQLAYARNGHDMKLSPLNDELEHTARKIALTRPR